MDWSKTRNGVSRTNEFYQSNFNILTQSVFVKRFKVNSKACALFEGKELKIIIIIFLHKQYIVWL